MAVNLKILQLLRLLKNFKTNRQFEIYVDLKLEFHVFSTSSFIHCIVTILLLCEKKVISTNTWAEVTHLHNRVLPWNR